MNPQDRENRGNGRDEKNRADQREDKKPDEARKEKADRPSRLGKEAKIGVAVILMLLGAFAAVVAVRVSGGESGDKQQLAAADRDGGHKSPAADADDLFKGVSAKSFTHQPTMVPPAKAPSTVPPRYSDNKWNPSSDRNDSKRVESRYGAPMTPPSIPPSFATDPPKTNHGSRYGSPAGDSLPGLEPEKPSRFDKKPKTLPPPPLPPEVKRRPSRVDRTDSIPPVTTRESFERGGSSGFADAAPRPPRREKSRYDNASAALMAPAPPPRDRQSYNREDRTSAGSSRSPYDDDFARASAPSSYEREKPRHYDSSSYGNSPLRQSGKYEIEPGDSYSRISEKIYGTGAYYQALAEQNRGKFGNPNNLTPGEVISTPSLAQLEKTYPELCPKQGRRETQEGRTMAVSSRGSYRGGRMYTVTEGDTLFNIARYELGKAGRWVEIYDLNRDLLGKDFNYLTPGMKLALPDEKTEVLTRRSRDSGDLYR